MTAYGTIHINRIPRASSLNYYVSSWKYSNQIAYTKYSIKETDFRVKTASFTSPNYFDLTTGQYCVLIKSKYHENFAGIILDVEYDEKNDLYTYQCQDWSRRYMDKPEVIVNNVKVINLLRHLVTHRVVNASKPTKKQLANTKAIRKGIRAVGKYDQSLYKGNKYKGNFFNKTVSMIIRDKTTIEAIRSIVFNTLGYYDVWFSDRGILQIEPISKKDWENTGLVLNEGQYSDRKFKFSTTNAITEVVINGSDDKIGDRILAEDVVTLDLNAFFGFIGTTISNSDDKNTSSAVKSTKTTTNTTTTANNKYGNPFNNKPKKVWINADNGSGSKKNSLASALKKAGWSVHIGATDSNAHYRDYWNVTKDYSVYITLYNGFCAGTIREAYSSKIQNALKKKGVQLCPIWDSALWTNPRGMKPFRNGDFSKYSAKRAWDDNFSRGDPSIKNVGDYFKKNKATYCVGATTSDIMKQFNAGGYFAYKGIKV